MKLGRNDPCRCGSGVKYKKCCSAKDEQARSAEIAAKAAAQAEAAAAAAAASDEEGDGESGEAVATAPAGGGAQRSNVGPDRRPPRPKLPRPQATNLPRRRAV